MSNYPLTPLTRSSQKNTRSFRTPDKQLRKFRIVPIIYTALAQPLLDYISLIKADMTTTSSSLDINLTLSADSFGDQPRIITANYGFDGYMSVSGLQGTGADAQAAAYQYGIAWELIDPTLGASPRAYYSAMGDSVFQSTYGFSALQQDTIPVVFSHPVLGDTLSPKDFRILLNTGEFVTPITSSFSPNSEFNERQTVVLVGDWGNRLLPDESGARYPISVTVVDDGLPLRLVTSAGLVSAVGLTIESFNPYVAGNGPKILAAKLNAYSDLGEGNPAWLTSSTANSGSDLYGEQAKYRLRIYTSAGFSADGISSILPTDFSKFFQLLAKDDRGSDVMITLPDVDYYIGGFGVVRVLGIADTGLLQNLYDISYVEDHDNQYDIILSGDLAAVARLQSIRMPSGEGYSPVYNPGGPGNDPGNNLPVRFTVASSDQTIEITNDFQDSSFVSYIEIDGSVAKDAVSGQPIGTLMGLAVHDSSINHDIYQYVDPTGARFYSSIKLSSLINGPVGYDSGESGGSGAEASGHGNDEADTSGQGNGEADALRASLTETFEGLGATDLKASGGSTTTAAAPSSGGTVTSYTSGASGAYNITINFNGTWTSSLQGVFKAAADRLSDLIIGDVPDVRVNGKIIDDISISAELESIDGVGGLLGQAGPTSLRSDSYLPAAATMQFDSADAHSYYDQGLFDEIVTHELLHCVGFASIWGYLGLTEGPSFIGTHAVAEYNKLVDEYATMHGGSTILSNGITLAKGSVPLETGGGSDTAGSHWSEAVFENEMMTGYINLPISGSSVPADSLSMMTAASLLDIGYAISSVSQFDDYMYPHLI